jgi:UDP-N-acetylmuramoyl-L-alanyl-D-glutamate--2,6-diaminopimelate ligase
MARWFVDRQPQQGIPSVSLRRLLPGAKFLGCEDFEVSGCTADSRRLDPGQVFVAVRGTERDGHAFVAQAIERGAAGVVVERPVPEAGRFQIVVPNSRVALAKLCQALAGDPSEQLVTIGVTGTTGASLTAVFLRAILEAAGGRHGLIGRLGWSDGVGTFPAGAAVPGAEAMASMLSAMVDHGCAGAVLELDAEALTRRRVEGVTFDATVVTDLGSVPAVRRDDIVIRRTAMARLFRQIAPGGVAVVNADDPDAELLGAVNLDAARVAFALNAPADLSARVEHHGRFATRFVLQGFDREVTINLRFAGDAAVSHALAAAAVAWARGIEIGAVVAGIESVTGLAGRLECIDEGQPFDVRIDESRHAAALREALATLHSVTPGRVHCVFGAEGSRGDRTAEERRALAKTAESLADRLTITTHNPRAEEPNQILDDLLAGFRRPGRVRIEPDRRRAIELTLADAEPGDAVLIAGKGRHTFQIFSDRAFPFDDAEIARLWLRSHRPGNSRTSA